MDERKREDLHQRLFQNRIGKVRSCRYPPEIRKEVQSYLQERLADGGQRKDICRELGIPTSTVNRWAKRILTDRAREVEPERFRPVVMALKPIRGEPEQIATAAPCTLSSPSGYRVEGLAVEQVLYLLRELR